MPETSTAPPPDAQELPLEQITTLTDQKQLQGQARINTINIRRLRQESDQLTQEVDRLVNDAEQERNENRREQLRQQLEQKRELQRGLEQTIVQKRRRSSALISRRNQLLKQEQDKKAEEDRRERQEIISGLRLPQLETRRQEVQEILLEFIADLEVVQRRARGPERRDEARRVMGVLRGCQAAHEALRRTPSLTIEPEDQVD